MKLSQRSTFKVFPPPWKQLPRLYLRGSHPLSSSKIKCWDIVFDRKYPFRIALSRWMFWNIQFYGICGCEWQYSWIDLCPDALQLFPPLKLCNQKIFFFLQLKNVNRSFEKRQKPTSCLWLLAPSPLVTNEEKTLAQLHPIPGWLSLHMT